MPVVLVSLQNPARIVRFPPMFLIRQFSVFTAGQAGSGTLLGSIVARIVIYVFCTIWFVGGVFADGDDGAALQIHVAKNGSDQWSGRLAEPNQDKTDGPLATLERARDEIRKEKAVGGLPTGGVTVLIHGGTYELDKTLVFSEQDGGGPDAPIVYRAADSEKVCISGGRDIPAFAPVTDEAVLAQLDPAARGKVACADLKKLGVSDFGSAGDGRLRLFFDDKPMTLARWPNDGFVKIAEVIETEPLESHGIKGDKVGKFTFSEDRPCRWANEKDAWVHGYWFWDWSDQRHKIESIDPEKRIIAVAPPYHGYGYRKDQWFYGVNLLCELDSPGEWYLDRESGILYFWHPQPADDNKDNGEKPLATVSLLDTLVKLDRADYLRFQGVTFEGAGDVAVRIADCKNDVINGCVLRNGGGSAVSIDGGANCGVENCELYNLGAGGISLNGGERKTLSPAAHFAVGNIIHDYGQWRRMYSAGISLNGVGNRAANNLIHSAPHIAVFFNGNDHLIELNEIHHVCMESNDAGAIYAGRDWSMRGAVIRHNFLHHITGFENRGCVGVYLDDMFCGTEISGNVFYKVTRAAFIGGGRDVDIVNNIFVDCEPALHADARAMNWAAYHVETTMKDRLLAMPYKDSLWAGRYPRLVNILDDEPAAPKGNVIAGNLCCGGRWEGVLPEAEKYVVMENNVVESEPGFVGREKMDFRLQKDAPILKKLPKLSKIPFEKIGPPKSLLKK